MMKSLMSAAMVLGVFFSATGCREKTPPETKAKQEYAETRLTQRADEVEKRIDALSARWDRLKDRWSRDVRPPAKQAEKELDNELDQAREWIDDLERASSEEMSELEMRAEAALDDLERRVDAALSAS